MHNILRTIYTIFANYVRIIFTEYFTKSLEVSRGNLKRHLSGALLAENRYFFIPLAFSAPIRMVPVEILP